MANIVDLVQELHKLNGSYSSSASRNPLSDAPADITPEQVGDRITGVFSGVIGTLLATDSSFDEDDSGIEVAAPDDRDDLVGPLPKGAIVDLESTLSEVPAIREGVEIDIGMLPLPPGTSPSLTVFDSYAFYLPFHCYKSAWGIYITDLGLLRIAAVLIGRRRGRPVLTAADNWAIAAAALLLHGHERFHYDTEIAVSRLELPLLMGRGHSIYDPGFFADHDVVEVEESMANAVALRALEERILWLAPTREKGRSALTATERFLAKFPPPYARYAEFCDPKGGAMGSASLMQSALRVASAGRTAPTTIGMQAEHYFSPDENVPSCPIRFVPCLASTWHLRRPFPRHNGLQAYVYTADHKPVHFHVEWEPGQETQRIGWPKLDAVSGPALSKRQQKNLASYLSKYGDGIEAKLRKTYPDEAL